MSLKKFNLEEFMSGSLKDFTFDRATIKKLVLLVLVCAISAVIFFPTLAFFSFTYKVGDVAVMDIKSPVEITVSKDVSIKKGEVVVREGDVVTSDAVKSLAAIKEAVKNGRQIGRVFGLFVFMLVVVLTMYVFARSNIRRFSFESRDLLFMAAIFIAAMLMLRFAGYVAVVMQAIFPLIPSTVYIYMIPVAAGAMLVRLFLTSETALVFSAIVAVMAGFLMGWSLEITAYLFIGGVFAAMQVRGATQRSTIIMAGLYLGVLNCVLLLSMAGIRGGATLSEPFFIVIAGLLNGMVTAIITVGLTPLLEMTFGYTTNVRLLELSRMDHPLLKELALRSPGTYHHSVIIGSLVEAAAESINANPLLARVSAYYHDIGKVKMPFYFIENMSGDNKHDKLTPSMSALIITNHVKEGIELANAHRLGKEITDIIPQHHGTSLISFFYNKAKEQEDPDVHEVDEKDFRYPGPKPQTKEAGLVMLADAIEATSRTLPDTSPAKIQGMTQTIVNRIFADGQLDECELTLKDLHAITKSFNRVLNGIFHQRVHYPDPVGGGNNGDVDTKEDEIEGRDRGDGVKEDAPPREASSQADDKKDSRDGLKRLGVV
ncbi:MAG: HDIG domain-containing protein [Deltaproteobacteria bacterium]|nr:HDIG domain-containing protein [Deltaproteobacteria bacterium]